MADWHVQQDDLRHWKKVSLKRWKILEITGPPKSSLSNLYALDPFYEINSLKEENAELLASATQNIEKGIKYMRVIGDSAVDDESDEEWIKPDNCQGNVFYDEDN